MNLGKTSNLVIFIVLISAGVGTASAVGLMVTVSGNFTVTGDSDLQGNVGVGGTLTPADYADESIQLEDLSPALQLILRMGCSNPTSLGFLYEGQVTTVFDFNNLLGGGINVGDTISGFYCYQGDEPAPRTRR